MSVISEPERSQIYTRLKHLLGAPLRSVELEDEMLDSLIELSIGDYEQYILDLYNELNAFFEEKTDELVLDWFIKEFDIPFKRLYPTELVKLL
jgi:hypothetical protein